MGEWGGIGGLGKRRKRKMGKYLDKAGFGEIEGEDKYLGFFL